MIRITQSRTDAFLRVEGRLDGDGLRALKDVVGQAPRECTIDLSGLTSMDRMGRGYLLSLREAGCRLIGGSLYVTRLLEEVSRDSRD